MKAEKSIWGFILFIFRILLVVILLVVMISTQLSGKLSKTAIDDVEKSILSSVDVGSRMEKSTNRMFKKIYGLNAGDYEGVIFYKPTTGMAAEEMLIVKLNSTSQAEEVMNAIQGRLSSQKNSFEGYGIEQSDLLNKAVMDTRGNYVFYMVHENASEADRVFRKSL